MIYSGNSFFDRQEVKDMMAYFRLVVNPNDDEAFRRSVNTPARGIGDTSISALVTAAKSSGKSLFEAAYLDNLEEYGLKAAAVARIRNFTEMIKSYNEKSENTDAYLLAKEIVDGAGLYRSFKEEKSVEAETRASNIEELANSVKVYVESTQNDLREEMMADSDIDDPDLIEVDDLPVLTLGNYLENISLLSAVDVDEGEEDSRNRVALMTVHASKGLEFQYVYVAGMEENIFPSGGMFAGPSDIEEERRLFYVALTRAQKAVELAFAKSRIRNGKYESNSPSRFIREIDNKFISNPLREDEYEVEEKYVSEKVYTDKPSNNVKVFKKPYSVQKPVDNDFVPVSVLELKEGQTIEHNRFGIGKILRITGSSSDLKAVINFESYGEKILILKYAKIRFPK